MRDLRRIVVFAPAGLNPTGAIERAQRLLAAGGTITVMDVLPELPALARAVLPTALDTMHLRERERELADVVRSLAGAASVGVRVLTGNPAARLSQFVAEEHVDLVVKVSAGATAEASLDPVDMKLLRKCPTAVWVAAPGAIRPLRTVLAAVDVFAPSSDRPLQESVIRHAHAAAAREGARVHVVYAWHIVGEHLLRRHLSAADVEAHINETRRSAKNALRELLREDPGRTALHLVRGEPPATIVHTAEHIAADLIVMGTVARTGLSGIVMGNTAELVLGAVRCEVLVLKPETFVSPLVVQAEPSRVAATA